ncbi:hypothetical protein GGP41_001229 [Bipolaris sorokiniana]|uniref:GMP synthase [glutamine-hydrolyzing] n=1 Tax=Cochliobolus sativus TaxID=45130 RepID=A0A8H6DRH3_COCSA|nr:hypothetical protein GGP41_001229 [Bipolaris sorokiniana]
MATDNSDPIPPHKTFDTILVLDFGSQYTHLITRRLRELNIYSEMLPCTTKIADLPFTPKGIILSGGPYSVYEEGAPHVDHAVFDLGVPILGICYGLQEMAWHFGKNAGVAAGEKREYGHANLKVENHGGHMDELFKDLGNDLEVWMSHGDKLSHMPEGFVTVATTNNAPFAGIAHTTSKYYGIHHTHKEGNHGIEELCRRYLPSEHKLDHEQIFIDASDLFLDRLRGVTDDPEKKRKIIGNTFIEVFQKQAEKIKAEAHASSDAGDIEWLLQGTLYPDVIESLSFKGPSQTIKTHHNVGGLPKDMKLKVIEPLRELFKDEVRELGKELGIPEDLVWRHPFPGPGIAIRILGEVTREQVRIAREADHIFIEEIKAAGLYRNISQAFAALLPVKAVGVMGDKRVHDQVIALRAVETSDFMTADWYPFDGEFLKRVSRRIVNEVNGVCRVVYDITSKPPGTIEME